MNTYHILFHTCSRASHCAQRYLVCLGGRVYTKVVAVTALRDLQSLLCLGQNVLLHEEVQEVYYHWVTDLLLFENTE